MKCQSNVVGRPADAVENSASTPTSACGGGGRSPVDARRARLRGPSRAPLSTMSASTTRRVAREPGGQCRGSRRLAQALRRTATVDVASRRRALTVASLEACIVPLWAQSRLRVSKGCLVRALGAVFLSATVASLQAIAAGVRGAIVDGGRSLRNGAPPFATPCSLAHEARMGASVASAVLRVALCRPTGVAGASLLKRIVSERAQRRLLASLPSSHSGKSRARLESQRASLLPFGLGHSAALFAESVGRAAALSPRSLVAAASVAPRASSHPREQTPRPPCA